MDLLETSFRILATVRRARAFHPKGATYSGWVQVVGDGPLPAGRHPARVRLSKGIGTGSGWPDFNGVAVRIQPEDAGPVDVLATTCLGTRGWRRLTLWPVRSWRGARLTTLMPWRSIDGEQAQVLLEVDDDRLASPDPAGPAAHLPVRLDWRVATAERDLQHGVLLLERIALDLVDLDPMLHHPPGWRVVPDWLAHVRESAYVGSREGRDSDPARLTREATAGR